MWRWGGDERRGHGKAHGIMGHRTAAMAKRYTHLEPGYLKEAVRMVEKGTG